MASPTEKITREGQTRERESDREDNARRTSKRKRERQAREIKRGNERHPQESVTAGRFVGASAIAAGGSFRVADFFAVRARFFGPTAFIATATDFFFGGTFDVRGLSALSCCESLVPWSLSIENNALEKECETSLKTRVALSFVSKYKYETPTIVTPTTQVATSVM
jgi:hypothetical protein